jgi:hypothetical protein
MTNPRPRRPRRGDMAVKLMIDVTVAGVGLAVTPPRLHKTRRRPSPALPDTPLGPAPL